jgi:hypothetical protein
MMFNGTDPQQKLLLVFNPPMQEIQPGVIYLVREPDRCHVCCLHPASNTHRTVSELCHVRMCPNIMLLHNTEVQHHMYVYKPLQTDTVKI